MNGFCTYCDRLKSAIQSENYCSHRNSKLDDISSNAFTFESCSINSGVHNSRFSIRAVYNGYQKYQVHNREFVLNSDQFLVVGEGERFEHQLEQDKDASGIVVAFNPQFIKYYLYYINHSDDQILDHPFEKTEASLYFFDGSYEKTVALDMYLRTLIADINKGLSDPLYYQTLFVRLLDELVGIENGLHQRIRNIPAMKKKTREELYKRLAISKDYIDARIQEKLSLEKIAQHSCLSPFHFLRSFRDFYQMTPYQYVLQQRLKKAHFLINDSATSPKQVMRMSGFDNYRTFQRSFQKKYGVTPCKLRSNLDS